MNVKIIQGTRNGQIVYAYTSDGVPQDMVEGAGFPTKTDAKRSAKNNGHKVIK